MTSVKDTRQVKSNVNLKNKLYKLKTQAKDLEELIKLTSKYEKKYGDHICDTDEEDGSICSANNNEQAEFDPMMRRRLLIC